MSPKANLSLVVLSNSLFHVFHGFGLEVGQVVNFSSVLLDDWKHFILALALKLPVTVVAYVFAMEVPRNSIHGGLLIRWMQEQ
ncbi:hypothetical protein RBB76_06790 [Tunturiibacter psychrotolerans]